MGPSLMSIIPHRPILDRADWYPVQMLVVMREGRIPPLHRAKPHPPMETAICFTNPFGNIFTLNRWINLAFLFQQRQIATWNKIDEYSTVDYYWNQIISLNSNTENCFTHSSALRSVTFVECNHFQLTMLCTAFKFLRISSVMIRCTCNVPLYFVSTPVHIIQVLQGSDSYQSHSSP